MSEPQPHEPSNSSEAGLQAERQRQVEVLADEYLERLLIGEAPDRQAFLAAHPDLAELLEPRVALVELMHHVARAQLSADGQTGSLTAPAAAAERILRVKCPHCGNGIQLVEPGDGEVTCGGCGSSFHVDLRATTSYHPADLPRSVGKFDVLEQLGRGAFGTVYKARDPQLQRVVAVKVPRAGSFATPQEEERFLREARAAAQLSHPGIVPVLEIAHDRGVPYIVSEYVEGLTLADVLTARRPGFREAAELVAAVADALDYAHRRQIVHRDIKPSNLLIDAAGRPHVTDFGLARRGEGEITVTLDGQILGTPAYMAPEQAAGEQQRVDARSDVYSLGVVLYEMLTGELPFRGNQRMLLHQVLHDEPRPPRSLNDRVPRDLETICLKAMAKVPGRRYASAAEMADDLRRFLNGEPIRARPVGRTEKLARWARRNPVVATLLTVVALLLIVVTVGAAGFALYQSQANRDLSTEKEKAERNQREAELRASSLAVDIDLKHCEDGDIEYGVLRLARTLGTLPSHATELRQCVEMNLLAWAQLRPLGPSFQHDGAETAWELSPDGLTVLTGGADGTARLWDAFTGEVRATLCGHRGKIASIAFSQDGRVAMTVGEDRTVRLWEVRTGQARAVTAQHPSAIVEALLSPGGERLLTICHETGWREEDDLKYKAPATLWDTATGRRISNLIGHAGHVNDAVFSPDGQTILTGGADKTARLWSADTGGALATLQGHTGAVIRVAFSPEGHVAATQDHEFHLDRPDKGRSVYRVRWWDPRRSLQIGLPCLSYKESSGFRLIHRDVAVARIHGATMVEGVVLYAQGLENGIEIPGSSTMGFRADDDCLFDSVGRSYDRTSGNRRAAPPGRKFSEELVRFATNGRFIELNLGPGPLTAITDLFTEKVIGWFDYYNNYGGLRYVPDRQTFVGLYRYSDLGASSRYIPIAGSPLDAEFALLFAEVVTCHELDPAGTTRPLDEATWVKRRRELAHRLEEHPAPSLISRVASDPWYWRRRQVDRAKEPDEKIKYLDRLIAVEPTWQNYHERALVKRPNNQGATARDFLEAGKLAGGGYWHQSHPHLIAFVKQLLGPDPRAAEEFHLGWQLAEALSHAIPEDRNRRVLVAIALYRRGRYAEAVSVLEPWQRERQRDVISQMGQFFIMPFAVPLLYEQWPERDALEALAFLAMSHHRLGHLGRAHALLADLRAMGNEFSSGAVAEPSRWKESPDYTSLLREAETVIEGRPQPGK